MHTMSAMETKRETVKSVDFGEVYADIVRLQSGSTMSFAAITRLLIKEGLKGPLAIALAQAGQMPKHKKTRSEAS